MDQPLRDILVGSRTDVYMAAELLQNNGILAMIKARQGAGFVLRAGDMMETYTLLVRAEDAEHAHELVSAFLTGQGHMAAAEEEEEEPVSLDAEMEAMEVFSDMEDEEDL